MTCSFEDTSLTTTKLNLGESFFPDHQCESEDTKTLNNRFTPNQTSFGITVTWQCSGPGVLGWAHMAAAPAETKQGSARDGISGRANVSRLKYIFKT
ncbi:hypothetical protein Mapa_003635 [Marchantia paleacea]|nr:hypothetical protein Mapa_003635 [Marchantia paleacea]